MLSWDPEKEREREGPGSNPHYHSYRALELTANYLTMRGFRLIRIGKNPVDTKQFFKKYYKLCCQFDLPMVTVEKAIWGGSSASLSPLLNARLDFAHRNDYMQMKLYWIDNSGPLVLVGLFSSGHVQCFTICVRSVLFENSFMHPRQESSRHVCH